MTPARKLRIHEKAGGMCGCGCGTPVPVSGPGVIYEHTIPFWMRPDLDDDGPNVKPYATDHSAAKTNGKDGDLSRIAKTKRQKAKNEGTWRKSGHKLQGRGFDKTRTRGFDGKVRDRKR